MIEKIDLTFEELCGRVRVAGNDKANASGGPHARGG